MFSIEIDLMGLIKIWALKVVFKSKIEPKYRKLTQFLVQKYFYLLFYSLGLNSVTGQLSV